MAAPTASDCNDTGSLLTQIGDLRLDATLEFFGDPMSFVAYSTLVVRLGVGATDDGIGLGIDGIERVDTELTVMEDAFIETEPLITSVLEDQLSGAIVDMLGGGALGGISLPEIDLSAQLGLPPGSAVIHIQTASVEHMDGVTVVTAHL
jgi:hypothetical protein